MKFRIRKWHVRLAGVIAALSVGDALYLWTEGKNIVEVVHDAIQVAVLLLLLELIVVVIVEQDEFLNYARGAIDRIASPLIKFEAFADRDTTHSLLRRLSREAIRKFLRAYHYSEHSWSVVGHDEALDSYLAYWQYLLDRQLGRRKTIVVQVVHSLDIAIWTEDKMKVILDKQKEFVEAGGEVRRVIVSNGPPTHSHIGVARGMLERGIEVYFVERTEFEHDFLVAPSLSLAVAWTGTVMARRVQKVEYLVDINDEEKQEFAERWDAARAGAVDAREYAAGVP